MQKKCWILYALLVKILSVTFAAALQNAECPFSHGFKRYTETTSNGTIQFCAKLFFEKESWDYSDAYCKLHYSSLTYKIGFNSTLHREWIDKGFSSDELLWVGIRRKENFFIIESTGELFRERTKGSSLEYWGAKWCESDVRDNDCVALNVSSGRLVTRACNSKFYQICDDRGVPHSDKLPKESSCPDDNWDFLSYFVLGAGQKCFSTFTPQPQGSAVAECEKHESRLATTDEYDFLFSENSSQFNSTTAYWTNQENNGTCVITTFQGVNRSTHENCLKTLPFTCVKELENKVIEVWITPSKFRPFPSTSTCASNPELFQCNVKVDGKLVSGKEKELLYQWYKDDIPIAQNAYVFRMSYFSEPLKRDPSIISIVTRQGSYHCEVRVVGSWRSHSSPKVNFFYSDISTYILNIHGIVPYDFRDYSEHDFMDYMTHFDTSVMDKQMQKKISRHGSATWDFQSIRARDGIVILKFLLYITQSGNELEEKAYQEIKSAFNYTTVDSVTSRNLSFSVSSADVCFSKEVENDTCEGNIRWPTSRQTLSVNTENVCLDESKRLVQRKCKPSVMTKAEWSEFNCSSCQHIMPRAKDLDILCSEGYTKFIKTNLCFKIHYEAETWHDAHRICSESSSYMLNEFYHDIAPLKRFWLSYTYSYGKIQRIGMKPQNGKFRYAWKDKSPDSHCLSAVLSHKDYTPKLENCNMKLPFVCVQNPFEVLSSVKFSNTWHKLSGRSNCYYFSKDAYSRQDVKEKCQRMLPKADFPIGIMKLEPYRYLKMLMHQQFVDLECQSTSWWINLMYDGKTIDFLKANAEYFDWDPYTDFNLEEAYGAITLFPNIGIYWTLQTPAKKCKYICEIPDCDDDRPTQAYIEDRSEKYLHALAGTPEYLYYLGNFSLNCIPSGLFLTHSISWYKDGILLNISSDHLSFAHNSYPSSLLEDLLQYQGYYWCSVDQFKLRRTTFSSKVLFKFPGIHTFVLSMKSHNKIYLEACATSMLSEISPSDLHNVSLNGCFRNSLNIFQLIVRNLTCNSSTVDIIAHIYFKEVNTSEEDILKRIQKANFLRLSKRCHIEQESISARSTVACYGEKTVLKDRNLTWPTTLIGQNASPRELCSTAKGGIVERKCLGDFNTGAVWAPVSINECSDAQSGVTAELRQLLENGEPASLNSANKLESLTSSPEILLPGDVKLTLEILVNFTRKPSLERPILNPVVDIFSNLIDVHQNVWRETGNTSSQIIEQFENIVSAVDVKNKSIQGAARNLAVSIHPINLTSAVPNCAFLPDWSHNLTTLYNVTVENFQNKINDSRAGIILPPLLVTEYLNRSDRLIYQIRQNLNYVENFTVVSAVIQALFTNASVYDIDPPVKMFFKLNEEFKDANHRMKCVFWDQRLNDSFGSWSYKGCLRNELNGDAIECSCNHLTSFSVIMALDLTPDLHHHEVPLKYITYVGCSLSCFGLGIIILTFICFRQWRKSVKNKALFNLSACLLSFLVLFMTGISKTSSSKLCLAISITLHYLLLASFSWMLVSAFLMYLNLVKVVGTYIPRLIQKAMLFAYGVPAVIVIITLSCGYRFYYQDKYCWLSKEIFYFAVASPVLTILLINFTFFGLILYANTCGKSKIVSRRTNPQDARNANIFRAKALFYTSVLLGLSWIFGFLAVGNAKPVFQYLFTITTTLQGFLFFLFFIVKQKSSSDMWRKVIFPSSISEKSSVSHISSSVSYSNRVGNDSESSFENVYRNVIFKTTSPYSPY